MTQGRRPGASGKGRGAAGGGRRRDDNRDRFGGAGGAKRGVGGGAGRTGAVRRDGAPRPKVDKDLGGEQIEGRQAVRELLVAGRRKVRELWIATELEDSEVVGDIVDIARSQRVQITDVNRKRLDMAARSEAPQGVIAWAAPLPETPFEELVKRRPGRAPFIVAVDGVTDPGNLGAIIRSADGAGVSGVVLPRHRAVHVTPTVAKAAAGAIEHVPMSLVAGLPNALARMKDAGIWIVGLDDAGDRNLFELGDLAAEGICLVLGAEGAGLSRLVRERCDLIVHIPMRGRLSSLNVSNAAALAMYEITRHR
ncbi:MAG: hypothetical protein RL219_1482 [Actinomycetota bacterium]|jgi:23S rRNA (guanosine2251-2'-O)-methyltransferase